jgi:hypothetical protein
MIPSSLAFAFKTVFLGHFIAVFLAPKFEELTPEELIDELVNRFRILFLPCSISFVINLANR